VFSIMRDNTQAFAALAAFRAASFNLGDSTSPERLDGMPHSATDYAEHTVDPRGSAATDHTHTGSIRVIRVFRGESSP
jgi:hypothetical protein